MNQRFLAVCLFIYAGATIATVARTVPRSRDRAAAVLAVLLALAAAAVLANAAADLW